LMRLKMTEDLYAAMLEFRMPNEENKARFELDIITTGLEKELTTYSNLWRGDNNENVTVAGVKKLPEETPIFDYLDQMRLKYGGKMNLHLLCLDEDEAKRLMSEEEYGDYFEV